jgi:predicted nucleic acid-binding protein
MNFILDTTYVLPLFGVTVDLSPESTQEIKEIWQVKFSQFELYLPSVCLIEVAYKLNAEFRQHGDGKILERLPLVLPTVLDNPCVKLFHPQANILATEMAMKVRVSGHTDLMDCWIAGSAPALDGILLTEESELKRQLKNIPEFFETAIWNWKRFQEELSRLSG